MRPQRCPGSAGLTRADVRRAGVDGLGPTSGQILVADDLPPAAINHGLLGHTKGGDDRVPDFALGALSTQDGIGGFGPVEFERHGAFPKMISEDIPVCLQQSIYS